MTALVLQKIVNHALAEVGISFQYPYQYRARPRSTTWFAHERGFGLRHYATGREVYIVQTRMSGRLRTITIAPTTVISQHQALTVARRVIAYAQVGHDPATDRARIRSAPRFDDFLDEYWRRWSPQWKASTLATHGVYRRLYLDHAFPSIFIDELNEAHVTRWFAALNEETGPGAANRCLAILANMLTKAESWGYRLKRGGSGNLDSGDKWIADLTAAMLAASRRQDEQATPPEPQSGVQGQGGVGCRERREDAGRVSAAV